MPLPPPELPPTSVYHYTDIHKEEDVDCTCYTGRCSCSRLDLDPGRVGSMLASNLAIPELDGFMRAPHSSTGFTQPEEDAAASLAQQGPQTPPVVSKSASNKADSKSNLDSLVADASRLSLDDDPACCGAIRTMKRTPSLTEALSRVGAPIQGPEQPNIAHAEQNGASEHDDRGGLGSLVDEQPRLPTAAVTASGRPTSRRKGYYTREEVAQHNKIDDCWLIAHGRVYDVTSVLFTHPAGAKSIMRHAGTDSTVDYDFHSAAGRKLWVPLQIGYVDDGGSQCTIS